MALFFFSVLLVLPMTGFSDTIECTNTVKIEMPSSLPYSVVLRNCSFAHSRTFIEKNSRVQDMRDEDVRIYTSVLAKSHFRSKMFLWKNLHFDNNRIRGIYPNLRSTDLLVSVCPREPRIVNIEASPDEVVPINCAHENTNLVPSLLIEFTLFKGKKREFSEDLPSGGIKKIEYKNSKGFTYSISINENFSEARLSCAFEYIDDDKKTGEIVLSRFLLNKNFSVSMDAPTDQGPSISQWFASYRTETVFFVVVVVVIVVVNIAVFIVVKKKQKLKKRPEFEKSQIDALSNRYTDHESFTFSLDNITSRKKSDDNDDVDYDVDYENEKIGDDVNSNCYEICDTMEDSEKIESVDEDGYTVSPFDKKTIERTIFKSDEFDGGAAELDEIKTSTVTSGNIHDGEENGGACGDIYVNLR